MGKDRDRPITPAMWELGEVIWNARYDLSRGPSASRPPWPERENYEHAPRAAVDLCLAEAAAVLEHFKMQPLPPAVCEELEAIAASLEGASRSPAVRYAVRRLTRLLEQSR